MRKILVSILTLTFILSMITTIYAATGNITVNSSSESVKKGETFTVTIIGNADDNITGMQANFLYDSTKLLIQEQDKKPGTGYFDASGKNEIAILSSSSENLSKSGTLYTIKFKVLDTAEVGDTTVSITNAVLALVSGNTPKLASEEITITIEDSDDGDPDDGDPDDGNPNDGNPDDGNPDDGDPDDGDPGDGDPGDGDPGDGDPGDGDPDDGNPDEENPDKLPYTGINSISILLSAVLVIISIISFMSYKKYKNI